jgi:uncharacterized protein (TIGR02145 family)
MKKFLTLLMGIALVYSCSTSNNENSTTTVVPSIATTAISTITTNSAISGGTITSDGGTSITARGLCWSTSPNPTISLSTITNDGAETGVFTSSISGLTPNTTYYVRAYATNSVGTAYGNELNFTTASAQTSVTDIDGNSYQLVTICNQTWTKTNLNVSKYRNGDIIPQVTSPDQLFTITSGAWCYYNNDSAYGSIYGKMYNWYAVNDPRGLAPTGYHIPSIDEWEILKNCLGGQLIAGGKMKEAGTSHWNNPNVDASNSSGFTGLPGGGSMFPTDDAFKVGNHGIFWSNTTQLNTPTPDTDAKYITLLRHNGSTYWSSMSKQFVASVRCVKD